MEAAVEILLGREESYRFFSRLLFSPLEEGDIDELASLKLEEKASSMDPEDLIAKGFNDMGRGLHRRHSGTRSLLATDYTMCFDGVSSIDGHVAQPYESVFLGEKPILFQKPHDEVLLAYRKQGFAIDAGVNLPADHMSFEFEFLAALSKGAAEAVREGDCAKACRLAEASRDFLEQHVLRWIDQLCELGCEIAQTRFYRGVLETSAGYAHNDYAVLSDLLEMLERKIEVD